MKCNSCHVDVLTHICPLCGKKLDSDVDKSIAYPDYSEKYIDEKIFTFSKLMLFLTICAIVISITVNVFTYDQSNTIWSAFVTCSLFYFWVTIKNTILSNTHIGGKVLFQFLSLSVLLFTIDLCSGFTKWSTNYAIPFISISSTLFITILAACKKSKWYEYMGYLLATFFVSLTPILLFIVRLSDVIWPSVAAVIYSLLTVAGLFIFSDRAFKNEMKKRFYY